MRLNVYLISHPVIQKLSTDIINYISQDRSIKHNYHLFHLLSILLIYEVTRKWIEPYNIYIPSIDSIKKLCIFNPRESYLVLTNLMHYGNILLDIHNILPKANIQHINTSSDQSVLEYINNSFLKSNYNDEINYSKVVIIDSFLNISIVKILDYLIAQKKINISQIKIICITCNNNILEQVGEKYPLINIYTTKIYTY